MKNLKLIGILLALSGVIFFGCKKISDGPKGQKHIFGNATYLNGATGSQEAAPGALVHIAYGTKTETTTYDQTVVANSSGEYNFDGLAKGDYFITGEYTDNHGFHYTSYGYGVTVGNEKKDLQVDVAMQ
jgi:hypothetical protein